MFDLKLNINLNYYKTIRAGALFVFTLITLIIKSQINLIPNPSFEDSIGIPLTPGRIDSCKNWYSTFNSPDYFTKYSPNNYMGNCGVSIPLNDLGFQYARTGNFYAGLAPYILYPPSAGYPIFSLNFEILSVKLSGKLKNNHIYDFSLYYSLANSSKLVNNQLSAYFSVNQLTLNPLNAISQTWYDDNLNYINAQINNDTTQFLNDDTLNWNKFGGCFLTTGGEEYLSIGNFKDNKYNRIKKTNFIFNPSFCHADNFGDYAYYFIDDLSLFDLGYYSGNAKCKNDTTICNNTSIVIGNNIKDSSVIGWEPQQGLSCTNCPNPIANPSVTTKYYVTKTLCSFISKDSITVSIITPSIVANAGVNDTICLGNNTRLGKADSTYYTNYFWQPNVNLSCNNCAMPFASPSVNITYTLQRSQCGIANNNTVSVIVEDCNPTYTIPTIFTPNGDGINDTWGIMFSNTQYIKNFQLSLFNRWGELIIKTPTGKANFSLIKWDGHTTSGEQCADGIYFYIVEFEVNGNKKTLKGNVTLIR